MGRLCPSRTVSMSSTATTLDRSTRPRSSTSPRTTSRRDSWAPCPTSLPFRSRLATQQPPLLLTASPTPSRTSRPLPPPLRSPSQRSRSSRSTSPTLRLSPLLLQQHQQPPQRQPQPPLRNQNPPTKTWAWTSSVKKEVIRLPFGTIRSFCQLFGDFFQINDKKFRKKKKKKKKKK